MFRTYLAGIHHVQKRSIKSVEFLEPSCFQMQRGDDKALLGSADKP